MGNSVLNRQINLYIQLKFRVFQMDELLQDMIS